MLHRKVGDVQRVIVFDQYTMGAYERGEGNACTLYSIEWPWSKREDRGQTKIDLWFQDGPIDEHGVNGLTNEVLLQIVCDRLTDFEDGPFPCEENREALAYIDAAKQTLIQRTNRRREQGVEGLNEAHVSQDQPTEVNNEPTQDDGESI